MSNKQFESFIATRLVANGEVDSASEIDFSLGDDGIYKNQTIRTMFFMWCEMLKVVAANASDAQGIISLYVKLLGVNIETLTENDYDKKELDKIINFSNMMIKRLGEVQLDSYYSNRVTLH